MANDFRFLMYNSPEDDVSINAVVKDETIWLSQKAMAELYESLILGQFGSNEGEEVNHG